MNSSFHDLFGFLTLIFSFVMCVRLMVQFKFPDHPMKFMSYLVSLSLVFYLAIDLVVQMDENKYASFEKLRSLSLVLSSTGLLIQSVSIIGNFSLIQLKVLSRIPVLFALVSYSMSSNLLAILLFPTLLLSLFLMIFNMEKARYQIRIYIKLICLFCLYLVFSKNIFFGQIFSTVLVCFSAHYYFKFQEAICVQTLMWKEMNK